MTDSPKASQVMDGEHLDPEQGNDPMTGNATPEQDEIGQGIIPVESAAAGRSVAFPPAEVELGVENKPIGGPKQARGVEIRRELTMEERELAQAGYDHLEEQKEAAVKSAEDEIDKVDITEHRLKFDDLENALATSMITKDPSESRGLDPREAAERLARDGKNILTPPKKKGAFRKVRHSPLEVEPALRDIF